jgi:plastocyanin
VSASAAAPSPVDLVQRDTVFAPSTIAVRSGTVVRFPNADPFFHNVFSYASNARFDLGRYPEGDSRDVRLDRPGIVRVFCEVHEFMRAVILVTDDPYHAVVGEDGAFRMTGVPPGRHTLVAYHPDTGRLEHAVSVVAEETVRVELALER